MLGSVFVMNLEFFQNVIRANPTGLPLNLVKRPKSGTGKSGGEGGGEGGGGKGEAMDVDTPAATSQVDERALLETDQVATFVTPNDARKELDSLIDSLKGEDYVEQWRRAICQNMLNKMRDYQSQIGDVLDDIIEEQQLQLRMLDAFRRPVELVKDRNRKATPAKVPDLYTFKKGGYLPVENANTLEQLMENTSMSDMKDNKSNFVDKDRFRTLNMRVEAIRKIQKQLVKRVQTLQNAKSWSNDISEFVNALQSLKDYPEQAGMIERVVNLIRSFIANPSVTSNQFTNIMIMGVAGTGKTRLAGILGKVLSYLGVHAYKNLVEASVGDFIAGFEGQTEAKVVQFLTTNAEKVVFLDEAYALTKWDSDHKFLSGYSPEAVAELIAFLSKNVGKVTFVAAGYEDKMMNDFMAANEGFERRFPIRVTLQEYENMTLYGIFIHSLALSIIGNKSEENQAAFGQKLANQKQKCIEWFQNEAVHLLYCILDASKEPNEASLKAAATIEEQNKKEEEQQQSEQSANVSTETLIGATVDAISGGMSSSIGVGLESDATPETTTEKKEKKAINTVQELRDYHGKQMRNMNKNLEEKLEKHDKEFTNINELLMELQRQMTAWHVKFNADEVESRGFDPAAMWPYLDKLFSAQAGAMTNMAGVAAALIISNKDWTSLNNDQVQIDKRGMFAILMTWIQTTFTGEDENGQPKQNVARDEMLKALKAKGWIGDGENGAVWLPTPPKYTVAIPSEGFPVTLSPEDAGKRINSSTVDNSQTRIQVFKDFDQYVKQLNIMDHVKKPGSRNPSERQGLQSQYDNPYVYKYHSKEANERHTFTFYNLEQPPPDNRFEMSDEDGRALFKVYYDDAKLTNRELTLRGESGRAAAKKRFLGQGQYDPNALTTETRVKENMLMDQMFAMWFKAREEAILHIENGSPDDQDYLTDDDDDGGGGGGGGGGGPSTLPSTRPGTRGVRPNEGRKRPKSG